MDIANKTKNLSKYFFIGILLVVMGLVIMISPTWCKRIILVLLGILAVVNGIYSLIFTRKLCDVASFQYSMIFKGMLSIVIGLLSFFLSIFEIIIGAMVLILAFYFILEAGIQMFASSRLKLDDESEESGNGKKAKFEALVSVVIAVILFLLGFDVVIYIAGVIMILVGAVMIFFDIKHQPIVADKVEVYDDVTNEIE